MEEALEQIIQTTNFWKCYIYIIKVPRASELIRKKKIACNLSIAIGQNVHVHSGHIYISFAFLSAFFRE